MKRLALLLAALVALTLAPAGTASAATDTTPRLHREGRFLSMTYRPNLEITQPTQIFVSPLTSPHGYDVRVTGGSATKTGSIVQVSAMSSTTVTVKITPKA